MVSAVLSYEEDADPRNRPLSIIRLDSLFGSIPNDFAKNFSPPLANKKNILNINIK